MVFSLNELRHERAGTLKDQTSSSEDNGDALEERDWGREGHSWCNFLCELSLSKKVMAGKRAFKTG